MMIFDAFFYVWVKTFQSEHSYYLTSMHWQLHGFLKIHIRCSPYSLDISKVTRSYKHTHTVIMQTVKGEM